MTTESFVDIFWITKSVILLSQTTGKVENRLVSNCGTLSVMLNYIH